MNNLDFFEELYKSISANEQLDENKIIVSKCEEHTCMITQEPLTDYHIKLTCGHNFNYEPLYNEVYYQKVKRPTTETTYLQVNQFKCPYCRSKQNFLLPPSPFSHLSNCYGVNLPKKYCYAPNECKYIFSSGKRKGNECSKRCVTEYCESHTKLLKKRELKYTKTNDTTPNKVPNSKHKYSRRCCAILKSGKKKGHQCSSLINYKTQASCDETKGKWVFCGRHKGHKGDVVIIQAI